MESGGIDPHTFLTSVLDEGEWSASRPSHFNLGEPPLFQYPMVRRVGGPHIQSGCGGEKGNASPLLSEIEHQS